MKSDHTKALVNLIRKKAPSFMDKSIRTETTLNAFAKVNRELFLPREIRHLAGMDESITVGFNSTTSRPSTLAFMFDKLTISEGDCILEIGTGVGYAAAVVSQLCGETGWVYTVEIVPQLVETARNNVKAFRNITVIEGDGSFGCNKYSPFDVIFFSAGSGPEFDYKLLLGQLKDGGRLMFPRRFGELFLFTKQGDTVKQNVFYTVSFVHLMGRNSGW